MTRRAAAVTALGVAALGFLGYGGRSLQRVWHMKQEVETLEREIRALRTETAELSREVARLRTDPEALEQLARERLGLVKPGEKVLKLPPTPETR
ncbi:MAG TPA: septum formation initiator family protein [Methylomirabilota bacterium]|nr:septum formation initiator family protein [Methylomirabilota bacterium]